MIIRHIRRLCLTVITCLIFAIRMAAVPPMPPRSVTPIVLRLEHPPQLLRRKAAKRHHLHFAGDKKFVI